MSVGVCLVCVYRRIPWYPIRIRLGYETCVEYDRIHVSSDTRVYPAKFVSLRIREFPRIHVFVSVSFTYSNITGYEPRPARIWDTAYEKDTKRIRVSQHVFGIQKGYMYPNTSRALFVSLNIRIRRRYEDRYMYPRKYSDTARIQPEYKQNTER